MGPLQAHLTGRSHARRVGAGREVAIAPMKAEDTKSETSEVKVRFQPTAILTEGMLEAWVARCRSILAGEEGRGVVGSREPSTSASYRRDDPGTPPGGPAVRLPPRCLRRSTMCPRRPPQYLLVGGGW